MFNGELDDDDLTLHMTFYVNQTLSQLNAGWRYSAQITQTEIKTQIKCKVFWLLEKGT
jgi:hypothetical protein